MDRQRADGKGFRDVMPAAAFLGKRLKAIGNALRVDYKAAPWRRRRTLRRARRPRHELKAAATAAAKPKGRGRGREGGGCDQETPEQLPRQSSPPSSASGQAADWRTQLRQKASRKPLLGRDRGPPAPPREETRLMEPLVTYEQVLS